MRQADGGESMEESEGVYLSAFSIVLHSLVFLIGFPGNLLVLCVYWSKPVKTSTHVLINSLAALDLATCTSSGIFLLWLLRVIQGELASHVYSLCTFFLLLSSMLITTAVAFDRFEAICRPHRRFVTPRRARALVCICIVIAILIAIPSFVQFMLFYNLRYECTIKSLLLIFTSCAFCFGCVIAVAALYVKIYVTVHKRGKVGAANDQTQLSIVTTELKASCKMAAPNDAAKTSTLTSSLHRIGKMDHPDDQLSQAQSQLDRGKSTSDAANSALSLKSATSTDSEPLSTMTTRAKDTTRPSQNNSKTDAPSLHQINKFWEQASTSVRNPINDNLTQSEQVTVGPRLKTLTRKPPTRTVQPKLKMMAMLIISTAVFFATWVPFVCITTWLDIATCYWMPFSRHAIIVECVLAPLVHLNCMANPFIYSVANVKFRKSLALVVRKVRAKVCPCCNHNY